MPRKLFLFALLALFVGFSSGADQPAPAKMELPQPDADGFISLFNGKDLAGWEGLPGYWSVKDDAINGFQTRENSKHTFIVLSASKSDPAKFADFELHLKYRFIGATGNSGIQFRSKMLDPTISKVGGYQADMDATRKYDGGLYDEAGVAGGRMIMAPRGFKTTWDADTVRKSEPLPDNDQQIKAIIKPAGTPDAAGEWNDMILIVNGRHFTIHVNGHLTCDAVDDSPKGLKEGLIALQMHTGLAMNIQFKDIKIKFPDGQSKESGK